MEKKSMKKRGSLQIVLNRHLVTGMLIIMVLSMVLEMVLIVIPSMNLYKRELKHEGAIVTTLIGKDKIVELLETAREIYYSTPEEIRSDQFSDEYTEKILSAIGDDYDKNHELVAKCGEEAELISVYYTFYDEEMHRAVMALNGYEKDGYLLPGQWIPDENGELLNQVEKTIDSDWYMVIVRDEDIGWIATNFDPIYDGEGQMVGAVSTTVKIDALENAVNRFLLMYIPIMILIILLRTVADARWTKKRVIKPLTDLTGGARKYAGNRGLDENNRFISAFRDLEIKTGDEIEELWKTMSDMETEIEASMVTIKKETATKERLETEMNLATQIQKGSLPVDFSTITEGGGFTLFASMQPAKEVGGDFYDFFRLDENHTGLVIADVSGKGVPAALFMMISKALLRNTAMKGGKPSEILREVNDSLCGDNPYSMFVTVWIGILDTRTGEVVASNGGHEYPFLTGEDGKFSVFEEPHGIALGCMEGMEYEDYSFTIPKGGMLYVYTDGVAEAHNEQGELFDLERIEETLNTCCDGTPSEVIEVMKRRLDEFKGKGDQFDDITMLAVKNK